MMPLEILDMYLMVCYIFQSTFQARVAISTQKYFRLAISAEDFSQTATTNVTVRGIKEAIKEMARNSLKT